MVLKLDGNSEIGLFIVKSVREAAKNGIFLVARPLRGDGGG